MNLDKLKMIFGFILLGILAALITLVALGHVNKDTSYGLDTLITGLLLIIQQWASWAFNRRTLDEPKDPQA